MSDLLDTAPTPANLAPATPKPADAPKVEGAPSDAKPADQAPKVPGTETPPPAVDLRKMHQAARKAQKAADEKLTHAQKILEENAGLMELAKTDPNAFAVKLGYENFEAYLGAYAAKRKGLEAPIKTAEEEIADLKAERDAEKQARNEAALATMREEIGHVVDKVIGSSEEYDLINTYDRRSEIATLTYEWTLKWEAKGFQISEDQGLNAAKWFANRLEAQLEVEHFETLARSKKFAKRFRPAEASNKPANSDNAAPSDGQKTLNNNLVREAPPIEEDFDQIKDPNKRWEAIKRKHLPHLVQQAN